MPTAPHPEAGQDRLELALAVAVLLGAISLIVAAFPGGAALLQWLAPR